MKEKSVLMSIRPQYVAKILNGEKTIEVRKKFPKDYVGWVYIYCTKAKPYLIPIEERDKAFWEERKIDIGTALNGKVVARFWCDKVEEIEIKQQMGWNYPTDDTIFQTKTLNPIKLLEKSCLDYNTLDVYLGKKSGYVIRISNLKIFDKAKDISDLRFAKTYNFGDMHNCRVSLTKAPQNFVYVEDTL